MARAVRLDLPLDVIAQLRGLAGQFVEYDEVVWLLARVAPPFPRSIDWRGGRIHRDEAGLFDPSSVLDGCGLVVLRRPRDERVIGQPCYVIHPGDVRRSMVWPEETL